MGFIKALRHKIEQQRTFLSLLFNRFVEAHVVFTAHGFYKMISLRPFNCSLSIAAANVRYTQVLVKEIHSCFGVTRASACLRSSDAMCPRSGSLRSPPWPSASWDLRCTPDLHAPDRAHQFQMHVSDAKHSRRSFQHFGQATIAPLGKSLLASIASLSAPEGSSSSLSFSGPLIRKVSPSHHW